MIRRTYIEQIRRLIYNGQPSDDATITIGLVNVVLNQAIAYAAKQCYAESIKLDGVAWLNNSFYTTYKGIAIEADEHFLWKVTLPHIPLGLGENEGINTLQIKDSNSNQISQPIIWITQAQKGYYQNMRSIPNKILAYQEGTYVYLISSVLLNFDFTCSVTMASGGSSDLDSTINVPNDYFQMMNDFLLKYFLTEKQVPQDNTNDGVDNGQKQ